MRRTRPKAKLGNSPLSLVLCQVRFSRLEAMREYIPQVQDALRRKGYPVNESGPVQEVRIGPGGAAARERMRWEFLSKDRNSSVVLNEGFVVLQTTAYDNFETFIAQVRTVVGTVNDAVEELLVQRVGLRYVDAIVPRSGETWRKYVKPCLHGFESPHFKEQRTTRLHQTVAETDAGTMLVRLHQNREGVVLPPDLSSGPLKAPATNAMSGDLITLIDIDHFHVCDSVEYDPEHLENIGWSLKDGAYAVFADQIVTKHAMEVWK